MPSNHLILSCPSPSVLNLSQHQGLFSESALHIRWPKYWSFSLGISPSNEYSGLISFRIDWVDLLAVQGTHKSLLQHHSLKASILWHSVFFMVQLSHLYITTRKIKALTIQTFVDKVMSLIFNTLSRVVIAFLPRSKRLFISWLGSPSAVILEPKKVSLSLHCFYCFPIYFALWSDGTECHDLSVLNVASSVTQSCLTLCEPLDNSPPGSSVHGIFQTRILKWVAISSFNGSSWPTDWTHICSVSCIGRQILYHCATWEVQLNVEFKSIFSRSSFTFIKRLFSSSSLSVLRVASSAYLRFIDISPGNLDSSLCLIPACASSSPAFCMMYSAYKLNKYSDNIQPDILLSKFWTSLLFYVWF